MTALADPFSRVHPLFWPVLWLSLRAFVAWTGRLIEEGHGYAGLSIEITWYGWIHVTHLDLSPERARLNRYMAGETDWRSVLAEARLNVEGLLAPDSADSLMEHACHNLRLPLPVAGCEGKGSKKSILLARPRVRAGTYRQGPVRVGKPPPSPLTPLPRTGEGNARNCQI
ncbi:MAG: hypothetical protein MRY64_01285 [Hyphomonadaceae bacterium]|nr:hypothetical protein [Hyphomonadaceae bacterium]